MVVKFLVTMEKVMRVFIVSYAVSVFFISLLSMSAVQSVPLDTLSRICVYLGFPSAIALSMILITLGFVSSASEQDITANTANAARNTTQNPISKVA